MRKTLREIQEEGAVDAASGDLRIGGRVVGLVYFRAGYTPSDYHGDAEWDARRLIERSNATKCPTVAMQLAGSKKVQQDLAKPGVVERELPVIFGHWSTLGLMQGLGVHGLDTGAVWGGPMTALELGPQPRVHQVPGRTVVGPPRSAD